MKDFCKWLGVNEKIAKVVVWLTIIMGILIITNIMLESIGLPYYKITIENLSKINTHKILDYLLNWLMILFNFYSVVFLIFRIREFKKIFPYSILYLIFNIVIFQIFGNGILQIFIIMFIILFCFLYSKKNWKYALYGLISYIIGVFFQFLCYLYKARFIDFSKLSVLNQFLTSLDFFILMLLLILIKEIILKRKENK